MLKPLNKSFYLFRAATFISNIGSKTSLLALTFFLLKEDKTGKLLGWWLASIFIVRVFLLPFMGKASDQFSRKKLALIADGVRFISQISWAVLFFFNFKSYYITLLLGVILGVGDSLYSSISISIIPRLVPKDDIEMALRQTQALNSTAQICGAVFAGLIASLISIEAALFLDALTFLLSMIFTSFVVEDYKRRSTSSLTKGEVSFSYMKILKTPIIATIIIFFVILNFVTGHTDTSLPMLVDRIYKGGPFLLGLVQASVGVGSILGPTFVLSYFDRLYKDHQIFIGIIIASLSFLLIVLLPHSLYGLMASLVFLGIGLSVSGVVLTSHLVKSIPDTVRGRVTSLIDFFIKITNPLATALVAPLLVFISVKALYVSTGFIVLLMALLLYFQKSFKHFYRLSTEKASLYFEEK